jgi:hypothetical protein
MKKQKALEFLEQKRVPFNPKILAKELKKNYREIYCRQ